ncbi:MAG: hypothetical protein ACXAEF_15955, partial [Candidatus Thorarchaeota archaeon]
MRPQKGMVFVMMLILGLGVVGINAIFQSSPSGVDFVNPIEQFELAYTHHDAIWIQSNQEMIDQADAESWSGNGTREFPYVITGYSFNQ